MALLLTQFLFLVAGNLLWSLLVWVYEWLNISLEKEDQKAVVVVLKIKSTAERKKKKKNFWYIKAWEISLSGLGVNVLF